MSKKTRKHPYLLKTIAAHPGKEQLVPQSEYLRMQQSLLTMQELSQTLVSQLNVENILNEIMKTLGKALDAVWVNIWELTPDGKATYIRQGYGRPGTETYVAHSRKVPLKLGTAFIGRAIQTRKTWSTSDMWTDPHLPRTWVKRVKEQGFRGIVCASQIVESAKAMGGMCVYFDTPRIVSDFEMRLITIAANQAAVAIINARIYDELLAERNKTASIITNLNEGVIFYDNDARIILINPKAIDLLSIQESRVVGNVLTPEKVKEHSGLKNIYAVGTLSLAEYETKEYRAEESPRVVLEVTAVPVYDASRKKLGTMRILRDITREKEVELLKSGFISTASHQMRTPLSGMRWALDVLLKGDIGPLNPEQQKIAKETYATASNLIEMINDLLNISKIEEGELKYVFQKEDIGEIVKGVSKDLGTAADLRDVTLSSRVMPDLPHLEVDKHLLGMAIKNVVDNAIRYSHPGGAVVVSLEKASEHLVVTVRDQGIGIPEKDKKFIFLKFFRADNAIRSQTEGSGLGLAIAKHIIERHNGRITFESEENNGTTFTIYLPLNRLMTNNQ